MDTATLRKFTNCEGYQVLKGGQNESIKVGDLVIKPVHEKEKYLWLSEVLGEINFENLRVATPLKSKGGNFIEDSFGATPYFEAQFYNSKLEEKLDACRELNSKVAGIRKPKEYNKWESPWTKAQSLAWSHKISSPLLPKEIEELIRLRTTLNLPEQLIHVDLAGNILFDEEGNPIIIDFTPGFYPKEYSEVLLLIDSIAWYQASMEALHLLNLEKDIQDQLILRALIFRLSVPLFLHTDPKNKIEDFQKDYQGYSPIVDFLKKDIKVV